eukprot:CAMPEP_0194337414 /NCGR_PEP_ID=MMETSP0171-20130528/76213_1 /TAXON_ID=218684 /ORGANISM="Corethron pennatum, Strain L29A3" /LENGTH=40 /DNA_ID= /DNA_START= /DNA_END= /DNA_ORIENTATION=
MSSLMKLVSMPDRFGTAGRNVDGARGTRSEGFIMSNPDRR